MSQSDVSIHSKIILAMAAIPPIEKNRVNKFNGTSYADIGAISAAINEPFYKSGLIITQETEDAVQDGNNVFRLETVCFDEHGTKHSFGKTPWFSYSWNPQDTGTALTYARRYGYVTALNLAAEDDDGELLRKASTEWATNEQSESLRSMVTDKYDDKSEEYKRWIDYMVRSGYLVDGSAPADKYKEALKKTTEFLAALEKENAE